jgi:hypothetical protein
MLVSDLINSSMRLINAIASGETPTTTEYSDALTALNMMVDQWAAERLFCYSSSRTLFTVTSSQQTYTIGPSGADWTAPRPMYIDHAGAILSGTPAVEVPMTIMPTLGDWAAVDVKTTTSTYPTKLYYEPTYPKGTVTLWPLPSTSSQVALYTPVAVSQFSATSDTISMPPGYAKAMRYCLAAELAPEFGAQVDPVIAVEAQMTLASLKALNLRLEDSVCDPALTGRGGLWSIYTDGNR